LNLEKKFINTILILSSVIIVTALGVLFYRLMHPTDENPGCATKDVPEFSGTLSISPEKQKGKAIFDSNCVACHKMNAKSTPDLIKNVFERIPNEEYFSLFITNEDSLLKANDKYITKLREEFPTGFTHHFKFTNEEIEYLKKYIK
jgi:hypothetical protein